MIWVNDEHKLDAGEHSVLSVIVYRLLGNEGQPPDRGWTTKRILSGACHITDKNARHALARLEARGLLTVTSKVGRVVGYLGVHVPLVLGAGDKLKPRPLGHEREKKRGRPQPLLSAGKGAAHDREKGLSTAQKGGRQQPPNLLIEPIEGNPLNNHPHPPPEPDVALQEGAEAPVVVVEGSPAALDNDSLLDEGLVARLAERSGRTKLELREQIAATVAEHAAEFGVEANRAAMRLQNHLRQGLARSGILDPLGWAEGKLRNQAREHAKDRHEAEVRATSDPEIERSWRLYGVELARDMLDDSRPPEICRKDPEFDAFLHGHAVRDRIASLGTLGMADWLFRRGLADMEPQSDSSLINGIRKFRARHRDEPDPGPDTEESREGPVINGHAEVVAEPIVAEPPEATPLLSAPAEPANPPEPVAAATAPVITLRPASPNALKRHEPTPQLPCDYGEPTTRKRRPPEVSSDELAASARRMQALQDSEPTPRKSLPATTAALRGSAERLGIKPKADR